MNIEKIQNLVRNFYDYTTNISITEAELLEGYYDKLSQSEKDYLIEKDELDYEIDRMVKADILWDFIYRPQIIIDQINTDIDEYGVDSYEFREIKDIYKQIREIFPNNYIRIERLEEVE